jgi:hypothetical protein
VQPEAEEPRAEDAEAEDAKPEDAKPEEPEPSDDRPEKDKPEFESLVSPLRIEGGPLLSPAVGPVPRTEVWGSAGVLYRTSERGRATYEGVGTRLVLGGEWSPARLDRLGVGGSVVAFQTTHDHVDLPPVVDEWTSFFDLGPLRLRARMIAYRLATGPLELALTPFFRLVLPTDTARIRPHRRMPIRRVLDDRVVEAPYVPIEPGVSLGGLVGPVSFYTHQAPLFVPIPDEKFHFLWSMHYGVGIRVRQRVEFATEVSGLMRATDDFHERKLSAWSVDPGFRLVTGAFRWELGARVGISDGARVPFGHVTAGFAASWLPPAG